MRVFGLNPIYNRNSKILILGSFPSVISRKESFYYEHPFNRFWKVLSKVFNIELKTKEEKIKFLLDKKIALWDTIYSCEIYKSKDSTIKNIEISDIENLIKKTNIKMIFLIGRKSETIYNKYLKDKINIESHYLPSPSSANASIRIEELIKKYSIIKNKLNNSG